MSDHEGALQRAVIARLRDDAGVQAVLGEPAAFRACWSDAARAGRWRRTGAASSIG